MPILKLQAPTKDYLWGGSRLVDEFSKKAAGDVTAQSRELSAYPGSESVIEKGDFAGKTITENIETKGKSRFILLMNMPEYMRINSEKPKCGT